MQPRCRGWLVLNHIVYLLGHNSSWSFAMSTCSKAFFTRRMEAGSASTKAALCAITLTELVLILLCPPHSGTKVFVTEAVSFAHVFHILAIDLVNLEVVRGPLTQHQYLIRI